ncbi:unnamed protein product [Medioppia subpectinata]|uniref:USP domain-containing protein n=1 Tax=Medioppia subpectinata TaxID=1979941 RepID=A0A7R9L113_9ACAR|nr:unnamed protein product [Medioppia subpectinata]CAG2113496.1 unnamed protein product [Medioppia subpectinata]
MWTNCDTIYKNNCRVKVDKSVVTESQLKQLKAYEVRVSIPIMCSHVPNRPLLRAPIGSQTAINGYGSKTYGSEDKSTVFNHTDANVLNLVNETVDTNDAIDGNGITTETVNGLKPMRRGRRSSGRKKLKTDSSSSSSSSKTSCSDGTKNKENKLGDNSELSRVIGLPNIDNTCYINALIQVLRITPGFRQFVCYLNKTIKSPKYEDLLEEEEKQLVSCLHDIYYKFSENELKCKEAKSSGATNESTITAFIDCQLLKNRFPFGQQQDCHELLDWLINELNSYTQTLFGNRQSNTQANTRVISNSKSPYNTRRYSSDLNAETFQRFNGVMLRSIECSECHTCSLTDDSFADIHIPLCLNDDRSGDKSVTDVEMQSFADIIHRKDYLKDDNMYNCHNCRKKTNASVRNTIKVAPQVMILFMKRPFGFTLKVTRNSAKPPPKKVFKVPLNIDYTLNDSVIKYSLYGFVVHTMGSNINNGHYYAVINSSHEETSVHTRRLNDCMCGHNILANNDWIKANDNNIIKFSETRLHSLLNDDSIASTAYLAFYRQIE